MKVNLNSEVSKDQLTGLYYEYKEFLIPSVALIFSVLVLLFFLIPGFLSLSEKKTAADTENQKLNQLKEAMAIVQNSDSNKVTSDLNLATSVLPQDKDFQGILETITAVSRDTGTEITNYSFQEGNSQSVGPLSNFPSLTFSITLNSTPQQLMGFIDGLYKKAPLSEVVTATGTDKTAILTVSFYYKPFDPVGPNDKVVVQKMTPEQEKALSTISGWNLSEASPADFEVSSESAETGSPF